MTEVIYKLVHTGSGLMPVRVGEIVRCKNCQYTDEPIYEEDEHDYWCRNHGLYVYENDYCSYGEKR